MIIRVSKFETTRDYFLWTTLSKIPLFLDEVELDEQAHLDVLDLILKEEFMCSVALTLDLLQADVSRWEELQGLQVPKVLSRMFLWDGK